ncbi:hypothetical protein, partial [Methylicorpusculum sp.]|uniref:hypothetical protein n=1 Tax=Methylicorpusculum sp. TaxID=2713644 RepID=UPI002ABA4B5D
MSMGRNLAMICFFSLFLPACARKKSKSLSFVGGFEQHAQSDGQRAQSLALLREWETTLLDLPFPLGALPLSREHIQESVSSGQIFLAYTVALSAPDLTTFYEQEMERLGWQKMVVLPDFETTLIFAKPDRICSISLRAAPDDEFATEKENSPEFTLVVL